MKLHIRMGLIAVSALILGAASTAWAGPATDELRGFFAEASRVRADPATEGKMPERITAIRRLVHQIFDFRKASELALGPTWDARPTADQDEFSRLFGSLLERAFIIGIAHRIGADGPVKVNYLDEVVDGDVITVNTTVVSPDGGITAYAYRMAQRGPGWVVIDVLVDGLSVIANYRAQFVRVLQNASFGDLLRRMQTKVADASELWTASVDDARRPPVALSAGAVTSSVAPAGSQTMALRPVPVPAPVAAPAPVVAAAPAPVEPKVMPQPVPEPEPVVTTPPAPAPNVASAAPEVLAHPVRTVVAAMKSYWVQVGAFANFEAAKRLAARLHEWRMPVQTAVPQDSQTAPALSRVRVGPFADRAEAESALRDLRARGFTPFIADK
jgi:phospholipid transport system substrate-binding protein